MKIQNLKKIILLVVFSLLMAGCTELVHPHQIHPKSKSNDGWVCVGNC